MQHAARLFLDIGKDDFRIGFAQFFHEFNNDVGTGGINNRHIAHTQNQNFRRILNGFKKAGDLRSAAEKQRTGQTQRHNAFFVQDLCQIAAAADIFQDLACSASGTSSQKVINSIAPPAKEIAYAIQAGDIAPSK